MLVRAVFAAPVVVLLVLGTAPLLLIGARTGSRRALAAAGRTWAFGGVLLSLILMAPALLLVSLAIGLVQLSSSWGGGVRLRRPGRRRRTRVDPAALGGVWSRLLNEALAARAQFTGAVRRAPRGAVRERLAELTGQVDSAVAHAWDVARRGAELERAAVEITAAARNSSRATPRWGRHWRQLPEDERVTAARRDRDAAAERLLASVAAERSQLQVLVARLGEAACEATELSVAGTRTTALGPGAPDLDDLLDRLAALRGALDEVSA